MESSLNFEQGKIEEDDIYKCPNCHIFYSSEEEHLPLTLPCGHIICKKCLIEISNQSNQLITCPIDTKIFTQDVSSLNVCKPFLQIPEKKNKIKQFICAIHKDKRIKYICEYDNETFCSKCLINHSKSPHKILNFEPNKERINNEIEIVYNQLNSLKNEYSLKNKKLDEFQNILKRKLQEESMKLKGEIQKIVNNFLEIQKLYEEKILNLFNYECDKIEESKLSINQIINEMKLIYDKIVYFKNKYNNKMNIIYNDIIEEKNDIIFKYEQLKRNNILNSNKFNITFEQLQLPKLFFQNENLLMNYTQNLIILDSEKYLNKIKSYTEKKKEYSFEKRSESSEKNGSNRKIKSLRKGSDPTNQGVIHSRFKIEGKDDKPILINNNEHIMHIPYYEKYNKNNNTLTSKVNSIKKRGLSGKSGTNGTTSSSKQSKNQYEIGC